MEFKKYLKKNFDDLAIVSSLGRLMLAESPGELEESDYTIWAAMERSTNELDNASFAEIKSYLLSYDEDQISGLVSSLISVILLFAKVRTKHNQIFIVFIPLSFFYMHR